MSRAARTMLAAALVLSACASLPSDGTAEAGSGGPVLEAGSSFEFGRWWYGTYLGNDRVEQAYLPLDLIWRPAADLRIRLGGDLAWSGRSGLAQDSRLDGPGDFRASAETALLGGRVRLSAGGTASIRPSVLTPDELHVAEALEAVALNASLARRSDGGRWGVQAAGLLIQTPFILVHGGAGLEARRPYRFEGDGREVDPGAVVRLGAGLAGGRASLVHTLDVNVDTPAASSLEGGGGFEPGRQFRAAWSSLSGSGLRSIRADLAFVARSTGSVGDGTPLDAAAVRGGNLLSLALTGSRRTGQWDLEAGLGGTWVRGFPGALGRASWVAPSIGASRRVGSGRIASGLRLILGTCREERDLRGVGFTLGWMGTLVP